jgi:ipoprotein LpqH
MPAHRPLVRAGTVIPAMLALMLIGALTFVGIQLSSRRHTASPPPPPAATTIIAPMPAPPATQAPSSPTSPSPTSATAATPNASVVVGGQNQYVGNDVSCTTTNGRVNIAIGPDPDRTGIGAVLSQDNPPQVLSVGVGKVGDATLGYASGFPGGNPAATKQGSSYTINGNATGVDMNNPQQSVSQPFSMNVTCPA